MSMLWVFIYFNKIIHLIFLMDFQHEEEHEENILLQSE